MSASSSSYHDGAGEGSVPASYLILLLLLWSREKWRTCALHLRSIDSLTGAVGHASTGEELGLSELWTNLLTGDGSWPPQDTPRAVPSKLDGDAEDRWYALGAAYWEGEDVPPNSEWIKKKSTEVCGPMAPLIPRAVSGVLGGLEEVHTSDIMSCRAFLTLAMAEAGTDAQSCVDCGGGMGRVIPATSSPMCSQSATW